MSLRHTLYSLLMLGFVMASAAQADTPVAVQIEVNFLLGNLDGAACEFDRNGTWHDSQTAQAHLCDKYKYLHMKGNIMKNS